MNYTFYIFLLLITIVAGCSGDEPDALISEIETRIELEDIDANPAENSTDSETNTVINQVEKKDYQEFYPTGELKIEGNYNSNEQRHGLWVSYYDNGIKWSESFYTDGKKMGHSITFYPNGKIRYVGEYVNDKQLGKWSFYTEEGDLIRDEVF